MTGENEDRRLDESLDELLRRVEAAAQASLVRLVDPSAGLAQLADRQHPQPVSRPARPERRPERSAGQFSGGAGRRVLIAEDEALIRLDLREMLIEEGYHVVGEAGDGETAVLLAEDLQPDLVILDIKMPIMDGLAAAEKIAVARIAPVVVLAAFSQRELVERARAAGAMAYLVKPFQKSDLVPAIEIALSRFAEASALAAEVASLTDRLETRKAVERAKGMLVTAYGMTEPQAFKWIQRTAVDHRMSMREVAERVIAGSAADNSDTALGEGS